MDRRKFLSMLGLAPVALAASKLPSVTASSAPPVRYANGGIIRPGVKYAAIGERGPEMVVPVRKGPTHIYVNTKMNEHDVIEVLKRYNQRGGNI